MQYKIGELYYDVLHGLICVTELYTPSTLDDTNLSGALRIGRYVRLSNNREYSLCAKVRRIATDADIIYFLTDKMLDFRVSDTVCATLCPESEVVLLNDNYGTIAVHRCDILGILEILNRELNF